MKTFDSLILIQLKSLLSEAETHRVRHSRKKLMVEMLAKSDVAQESFYIHELFHVSSAQTLPVDWRAQVSQTSGKF